MGKFWGTIFFIFLMILATAGLAAYVMQNALGEDITFVEFYHRYIAN
ncbi:MAG: hypothetical protein IJV66_02465 [Firmicutes bacterium]|nr:hypothetical protein [Bacillota bacterium]